MSRRVDGPVVAPLLFVKRDQQSSTKHEEGSFTRIPDKVEAVVRRAWRSVYKGNTDDTGKVVKGHMGKHTNIFCPS